MRVCVSNIYIYICTFMCVYIAVGMYMNKYDSVDMCKDRRVYIWVWECL